MLRVENIVFEGKCFLPIKTDVDNLSKVKSTITEFMHVKGYAPEDPSTLIFQDRWQNFLNHRNHPFIRPKKSWLPCTRSAGSVRSATGGKT